MRERSENGEMVNRVLDRRPKPPPRVYRRENSKDRVSEGHFGKDEDCGRTKGMFIEMTKMHRTREAHQMGR